jgi:hypothetical protein
MFSCINRCILSPLRQVFQQKYFTSPNIRSQCLSIPFFRLVRTADGPNQDRHTPEAQAQPEAEDSVHAAAAGRAGADVIIFI